MTKRLLLAAIATGLGCCGCSKSSEDLSTPSYLLDNLRKHWATAKADLHGASPNPGLVAAVGVDLSGPTGRMISQDYEGPNKEQLLKQFNALSDEFHATVSPMMMATAYATVLRPGYTNQQLRDAFMKLDPKFEAMIKLTVK